MPFVCLLAVAAALSAPHVERPELPDIPPRVLEPGASLPAGAKLENSGIVKSRKLEGVYWGISDSGNAARIFPIHRDGSSGDPGRNDLEHGVQLEGAVNIDWEDVAVDDRGNVVVGDVGNNANTRRDLVLYVLPEPVPTSTSASVERKIRVHYPEQAEFPPPPNARDWDCEAVFFANDNIYLVTKHRGNSNTRLYRVDRTEPDVSNPLTLVQTMDIGGMVTAADASPNGKRLVLTTYTAVWMFEAPPGSDEYFSGAAYCLPIRSLQVEGVCFVDDKTLLVSDERRAALFEIPVADLVKVR